MLITAAPAIMVVGIIEVIATGKLWLGPRCGNVAGSFYCGLCLSLEIQWALNPARLRHKAMPSGNRYSTKPISGP
jgi:hypothetical protein